MHSKHDALAASRRLTGNRHQALPILPESNPLDSGAQIDYIIIVNIIEIRRQIAAFDIHPQHALCST